MLLDNTPLDILVRALLLSFLALGWVIFVVRIVGLRAFSKMTATDFVTTIAVGSLLAGASQAPTWPEFAQPVLAIATLLGVQFLVARFRRQSNRFETVVQNTPMLLMRDGRILDAALDTSRVAEDDLIAKLREANVSDLSDVRAVVLETTGNISVLHGNDIQEKLLYGVRQVD